MSLKAKILLILFIASVASSVVTGFFLLFLLRVFGHIALGELGGSLAVAVSITVFVLSGLFLLIVLNVLLSKNVIIPAVERKMMDHERTMLTEQLHHSQKMEAVGRLAGSIAHDFNNLLTIIDGYASLIIADPKAVEVGQNAQEVVGAARKASFITRKLLSFSQKEQTEPILLDLNTTLQDTDKMLSRLIGERITLVTKPSDEPIYVLADPVQIGQVLMNLAVNARDAMPQGGRITIKIAKRMVKDGECGKPGKLPANHYAEISVHDTGCGIDEAVIGKIFEAFYTTKQAGKGTGLGLSIVKSIMKQNNGFIDVHSKLGNGATFYIYLPIADEETVKNATLSNHREPLDETADDARQDEPSSGATILLVEDDPMIRTLVGQTLELNQFKVLLAEEGWEAIKIARNHKGLIDLLFTDVVMPGLGGAELAMATKELYPNIKVLFMSGYSRSQLTEEGVPTDAAVLEKPFTPDKVISMIRKLLAR